MGGLCKERKSALWVMKYESFSSHECSTYTLFKLNSLFWKKYTYVFGQDRCLDNSGSEEGQVKRNRTYENNDDIRFVWVWGFFQSDS